MSLEQNFPALCDLRLAAKRRLPHFAFEYLDSGTGGELGLSTNQAALDAIGFMPAVLKGKIEPIYQRKILGDTWDMPIGIAPVGMSGIIWPDAEVKLARAATRANVPYCLSTVAAALPETVGPHLNGNGWWQMYPPVKAEVRRDMMRRAQEAGFTKLVITVDVPGESRRERQRRAGVAMPPKITPRLVAMMATRPAWCWGMAQRVLRGDGIPSIVLPESYLTPEDKTGDDFVHAGRIIRAYPDWDYLKTVRQEWTGHIIIKGVLNPDDAVRFKNEGFDAVWVSNHSARQFEVPPPSITQLPLIRAAVGADYPLFWDSTVRSALDVMRGYAMGADFVFAARAFHYGLGALGEPGADHVFRLIETDLRANLMQLGIAELTELSQALL